MNDLVSISENTGKEENVFLGESEPFLDSNPNKKSNIQEKNQKKKNSGNLSCVLFISTFFVALSVIQFGYYIGELNSAKYFIPVYVDTSKPYPSTIISSNEVKKGKTIEYVNKTCSHLHDWFSDCLILPKQFEGSVLDPWFWLVSIFPVGGLCGSLLGGTMANLFSRKLSLWIVSFVFLFSVVLEVYFTNFWTFLIGRFLGGFCSGVSSACLGMYLQEISPTKFRGAFGTVSQLGINIGISLAQVLSIFTFKGQFWRLLIGIKGVFAISQILILPFLPFSPRWLLMGKRKSFKWAYLSLQIIRQKKNVRSEYNEILKGSSSSSKSSFKMPIKRVLYHMMIAIGLQLIQQFSGITAVAFYSTTIFYYTNIPLKPEIITAIIGVTRMISVLCSAFIIDRIGRKPLLLIGVIVQAISLVALTICLSINYYLENEIVNIIFGVIAILSVLLFGIFFGIAIGPIPWFIFGEIFTTQWRSVSATICTSINWLGMFLIGLFFPLLQKLLLHFSFLPFLVVIVLGAIFIAVFFKETKGKSIEEICLGKDYLDHLQQQSEEEEEEHRFNQEKEGEEEKEKEEEEEEEKEEEEQMVDLPALFYDEQSKTSKNTNFVNVLERLKEELKKRSKDEEFKKRMAKNLCGVYVNRENFIVWAKGPQIQKEGGRIKKRKFEKFHSKMSEKDPLSDVFYLHVFDEDSLAIY